MKWPKEASEVAWTWAIKKPTWRMESNSLNGFNWSKRSLVWKELELVTCCMYDFLSWNELLYSYNQLLF